MKNKTAFCTDHSGPGGPVRYWTDVPREEQVQRVAQTLARRTFGKTVCCTPPRLLSINAATLDCHYGCRAVNNRDFFNCKEKGIIFRLEHVKA